MIKAIGVLIGVLSFSGITLAEEQEIYFVGGIYCVSKAIIGIQDGVPKFEMIGADVICLQVGIAAVSYRDEKLYISTNRKTYVYSAITYKFEYEMGEAGSYYLQNSDRLYYSTLNHDYVLFLAKKNQEPAVLVAGEFSTPSAIYYIGEGNYIIGQESYMWQYNEHAYKIQRVNYGCLVLGEIPGKGIVCFDAKKRFISFIDVRGNIEKKCKIPAHVAPRRYLGKLGVVIAQRTSAGLGWVKGIYEKSTITLFKIGTGSSCEEYNTGYEQRINQIAIN